MKKEDKMTAGETASKLWDENVDYTQPSPDRPYKLRLQIGVLVYLNKEQYSFMKEEEWQEKREHYLESRCQVSAERGGLKRCTEDCMNYKGTGRVCPCFMRNQNAGVVSLDRLYDEHDYEPADTTYNDSLDAMEHEEKLRRIREEVDKLEDEVDRTIIKLFSESFTERQIAEVLGWNQMKVNRRKNKILEELRSKLEDL